MSTFPVLPAMVPGPIIAGDRTFRLTDAYHHPRGTVPVGYITDGASVPRPFWPIFSPTGPSFPAALVHDHDYSHNPTGGTRKDADLAFLANMKATGLGWLHRHIIYRAVRVGAADTWRRYRGTVPDAKKTRPRHHRRHRRRRRR